jgi:hypothetical protein
VRTVDCSPSPDECCRRADRGADCGAQWSWENEEAGGFIVCRFTVERAATEEDRGLYGLEELLSGATGMGVVAVLSRTHPARKKGLVCTEYTFCAASTEAWSGGAFGAFVELLGAWQLRCMHVPEPLSGDGETCSDGASMSKECWAGEEALLALDALEQRLGQELGYRKLYGDVEDLWSVFLPCPSPLFFDEQAPSGVEAR